MRFSRRAILGLIPAAVLGLFDFSWASAATLNVKNFGAKGNGRADDTTAIRNAIAACNAGDTLQFPAGTYKVSDVIKPKSNITLDFLGGAKLVQHGNAHLIVMEGLTNVSTNNMRLRHNGTAISTNVLRIEGGSDCYFYNTTVERTDAFAVYVFGGAHHLTFNQLTILKGRTGNIDGGLTLAECHDITVLLPDIHCNDDAVSFKAYDNGFGGTHHVNIQGGTLESTTSAAIGFGNEFEGPDGVHAILIDGTQIINSKIGVDFRMDNDTRLAGSVYDVEIKNIVHTHNGQPFPDGSWPLAVINARKFNDWERTANIWIHDYSHVGEPWDAVHLMRVSGFRIENFTSTWPLNDGRYPVWLEDAHDNVFNMTTTGSNGQIRQDGNSYGNVFAGVYS